MNTDVELISNEFHEALSWSGHLTVLCACGRNHFTISERRKSDYPEGELERYKRMAKDSKNFVPREDDFISATVIDGITFVYDCQCERLIEYEKFIWSHRIMIAKYLKSRAAAKADRANDEADTINQIPDES